MTELKNREKSGLRQLTRPGSIAASLAVPGLVTIGAGVMTFFMVIQSLMKVSKALVAGCAVSNRIE
ncbi:MAG: hypothetical protein N2379_01475 [Verrucomicrobiae bacterium]|nr:hypothetical protein [Verrucomicrobiae bacterium]